MQKSDLYIIDPGLMDQSGHHAAYALSITETLMNARAWRTITIYANSLIESELLLSLKALGARVVPYFDCNFYKFYSVPPDLSQSSRYVSELCLQYAKLISEAKEPGVYFHPCLNWDHGWALSLALQKNASFDRHIVFLMIQPRPLPVVKNGEASGVGFDLAVKTVLESLLSFRKVSLFCPDEESNSSLNKLLGRCELQIHPSVLANWVRLSRRLPSDAKRIVCYLGDAKVEKGFASLPAFLDRYCESMENVEFYIQFTLSWPNDYLLSLVAAIRRRAKYYPNVRLNEGFLPQADLLEVLSSASVMTLNYDPEAYQYKTSGLLWMAGWFDLPVVISGESFLSREARRLDLPVFADFNDFETREVGAETPGTSGNEYRETLYQDFAPWLIAQAGGAN